MPVASRQSPSPSEPEPAIDRYDNGNVRFRGVNLDGEGHVVKETHFGGPA